jgi:hypothetical protein
LWDIVIFPGVWSRHFLERIQFESFRPGSPAFAEPVGRVAMRHLCREILAGTRPDRAGEQAYLRDQSQNREALGITVPPALLSLAALPESGHRSASADGDTKWPT